ncbi:hypothetical protein L207DRAFT_566219 [Hyaloscypha variabilis F]|uniref:Rhodopsin domain-containing protein n=1 Tax=Hyaloscypha variabilis (strain UAMH 11265 / GT02V1 / F) TaxID=1149755 RepID=A0A2J6RQR5_HYAVF|nr:hypothetical protein L207DRAFT_566219 [Hyaloscypha variabilis F]
MCLVITLRVFTRTQISKNFGADDWLILASLIPTSAFTTISLYAELHLGWNRHVWDVEIEKLITGQKLALTTQCLFSLATTLTKCSMLVLIHRIVSAGSKKMATIVVIVITLVSVECLIFCFSVIFQCGKPSLYWTLSLTPQGTCISETKNLLGAGIINTVTDFIVVVLPMPTVWKLKLPLLQQIIVLMLFSAGFIVICTGAVRTYYLYQVTIGWDRTWTAFPAWVSSSVELYVGIICASLPATKQFFNRYFPKLLGSTLLSHTRASTRLSYFVNSHRRSIPLDYDSNLEMRSPEQARTWKEDPDVKVVDWESSNQTTIVSSLKIEDERVMTPASFRTVIPDNIHALQSMDSQDELVPKPGRAGIEHAVQAEVGGDEVSPTRTRPRFALVDDDDDWV